MADFRVIRVDEVTPMVFPTGRQTRVLGGAAGLPVQNFAFGHVTVDPGGSVPAHSHHQEEVYTIIAGTATMTVNGEQVTLPAGSAIYLPAWVEHELRNETNSTVIFMFIYSPAETVNHWKEELEGH